MPSVTTIQLKLIYVPRSIGMAIYLVKAKVLENLFGKGSVNHNYLINQGQLVDSSDSRLEADSLTIADFRLQAVSMFGKKDSARRFCHEVSNHIFGRVVLNLSLVRSYRFPNGMMFGNDVFCFGRDLML